MSCLSLCNLSMEDKSLDDYRPTQTDGPYPVKEEVFTSPLSGADTAVWDASFNETDFTDDSINASLDEEKKRNLVYDEDQREDALPPVDSAAGSASSCTVDSYESGFCSRNNPDLRCSESSSCWSNSRSEGDLSPSPPPRPPMTGFEPYGSDIYRHRRDLEEKRHPRDCLRHSEITAHFRANLVSWLSTVNGYFQFAQDTLFLAVNIVDRCLLRMDVTRGSFQLLGATAFLIAGKHEEVTPPEINDLLWLCAEAYTRNQMVKMEELILDAIHFEMFVPTGSFFLEYYACCEMTDSDNVTLDEFRNARRHARYFLELSLQDYKLSQYLPSMLALCAWKWAVQDCVTEYRPYCPAWEVDFNPAVYKGCFEDFLVFVSKLKGTVSEANVLTGGYDHDDDSDVECLNSY